MRLEFLPIASLSVSRANMRFSKKPPDLADLLPTVRARGVLVPLIVRPVAGRGEAAAPCFEIVAGARRFRAAQLVAEERAAETGMAADDPTQLPCAILAEGDDAGAVEASLIENVARLDPDEVAQWETFSRLLRAGRSAEDIAITFGLPALAVRRVLALGNLLPRVRQLHRAGRIDRPTVRQLTLATPRQQKAWLALLDDPNGYAPTGHALKSWLFGGGAIPVASALFDVEASGLAIVADLFGEERYFADAEAFWARQMEAVETRRQAALDAGWKDAVIVPPGEHFHVWEYRRAAKARGGKLWLDVRASGEVIVHEGLLSRREADRLARGAPEAPAKRARPELSSGLQTYVDLHRHAAVRAALLAAPGVALRMLVAHMIVGAPHWSVRAEPQAGAPEAVRESVETARAGVVFAERRREMLARLDVAPEPPELIGGNGDPYRLVTLFERLMRLSDAALAEVAAIALGESLAAGSAAVEALGLQLAVQMSDWWQADEAMLGQLRDREVLLAMVAELAGDAVAQANAKETAKTLRTIVRDHLAGTNGRPKVESWVPGWLRFPPAAYTARGGVDAVKAHALAAAALAEARAAAPDAAFRSDVADEPPAAQAEGAMPGGVGAARAA